MYGIDHGRKIEVWKNVRCRRQKVEKVSFVEEMLEQEDLGHK